MENIRVRKGRETDLEEVLELIQELAEYEKAPDEVEVTVDELRKDGFGEDPQFGLFVAEMNGQLVGIALYYFKYSTWKGKALYLEDIVVRESYRRQGIGKELFNAVVEVAGENRVRRMEWQVLEWNEPAIEFYKKYDAEMDGEWINCQFRKNQLSKE